MKAIPNVSLTVASIQNALIQTLALKAENLVEISATEILNVDLNVVALTIYAANLNAPRSLMMTLL